MRALFDVLLSVSCSFAILMSRFLLAAILDFRFTDEVFQEADSLNLDKPTVEMPTLQHGERTRDLRNVSVLINLPSLLSTFEKYSQLSQITTSQAN